MRAAALALAFLWVLPAQALQINLEDACEFAWDYPADETRHQGFKFYLNGALTMTHSVPAARKVSCDSTGVYAAGSYKLTVTAYNQEKESAHSNVLEFTVVEDLAKPSNLRLR